MWVTLRLRPRKSTPARPIALDQLDEALRAVLDEVSRREPFTQGEIPGMDPESVRDRLDRLSAMGILKCELTVPARATEGRTVWTVFPDYREAPRLRE
jgi:hypothetical protein